MEEIVSTTDHYQRIYRKTMENYICLFCHWELTYRCNLYCRHCYATGNQNEGEFSLEKAKSILDELKEMTVRLIKDDRLREQMAKQAVLKAKEFSKEKFENEIQKITRI